MSRKIQLRLVTSTAAALLMFGISVRAEPSVVAIDVIEGELASAVNRSLLAVAPSDFGGAVIIEHRGKTILKAGYGFADREARTKFTTGTIAQIGSISKSFTAAAIADLEDLGKVNPQSPISKYLPELAGTHAGKVTIQQLLTHTSGFPEYCGDDFERSSVAKQVGDCFASLNTKPGSHSYSNAGYSALAIVVERVTGKSLETYLKERVTGPLGMINTGYLFEHGAPERFAKGYLNGVNQGVISDRIAALDGEYWNLKGNGGIQATSEDMVRWGKSLFYRPSSFPAMANKLSDQRRWVPTDQPNVHYSYGLYVVTRADQTVLRMSHGGSDGVFSSLFRWYPNEEILIYFVGNSGEDEVKQTLAAVIDALRSTGAIRE